MTSCNLSIKQTPWSDLYVVKEVDGNWFWLAVDVGLEISCYNKQAKSQMGFKIAV